MRNDDAAVPFEEIAAELGFTHEPCAHKWRVTTFETPTTTIGYRCEFCDEEKFEHGESGSIPTVRARRKSDGEIVTINQSDLERSDVSALYQPIEEGLPE